ncbi:AAA family ATPase [Hahella aquimaris]|uniref:AAA family ATPase n=1 Tax=Hahella sp. HNIBRBA332 TaxID=3015983 RepID=UPI00273CA2AC|nr:AAA family ATPase [Hahella sp. HNIBRBA332]WLQ16008.1 AAA family ATPase [Hahella sp. HNIBRBA332]
MKRKDINEVFTPRNSKVNSSMYVHRPVHEKQLNRALSRNSHTIIFGDSGNGKSWLYKKVLSETNTPFSIANCANASRLGSLTNEICSVLVESGTAKKIGFSQEKSAEAGVAIAKGSLKNTGNYEIKKDEPLLEAFKIFDNSNKGKKILVLDNLESIFENKSIMSELADIIILLDDSRYSQYNINLLIVGIPNGVLDYFRETKNFESVANRISEIGKVTSLDENQVEFIVSKGFSQLKVNFDDKTLKAISKHVWYITLGTAQRVHEYCEALAHEIKDNNWTYEEGMLQRADKDWLIQGLRHGFQAIEGHLNSRETTVARRNQVIFCISKIRVHQFDSNRVESLVKKEFPQTIPETKMGIGSILSELSKGNKPLLNKSTTTNTYSVRDPRYIMCIRVMLRKDKDTQKVIKRDFTRPCK